MDITYKIIIAILASVAIIYLVWWTIDFVRITGEAFHEINGVQDTDYSIKPRCDDPVYCKAGQPINN